MTLATAQIIQQGNSYHVQYGTDAGLYVEFYTQAIQDMEASIEQGRPIFNDQDFIKIIPVGDKSTIVCRPVKTQPDALQPADKDRWPQQYAAFKALQEQPLVGTPITEWAQISKSQAMMLKGVNVHTVDALAVVSDANLNNLGMGSRELREKAIAFLAQAKDGAANSQLVEKNRALEVKMEALQNQLNALSEISNKKVKGKDNGENVT